MENGQLDQKVENILVKKSHLIYGIVIATLSIAAVFYTIMLAQAVTQNKLDTLIAKVDKLENVVIAKETEQDKRLTINEKDILSIKIIEGIK